VLNARKRIFPTTALYSPIAITAQRGFFKDAALRYFLVVFGPLLYLVARNQIRRQPVQIYYLYAALYADKKQVSITEKPRSPRAHRRGKFQRQDTPIHPDIITLAPKHPNMLKVSDALGSKQYEYERGGVEAKGELI
jgi:hypothetical protein